MKILILGYGKMGKTIEKIAGKRGHQIVGRIDLNNQEELALLNGSNVDVAIEFSQPDAALKNIKTCLNNNIKVISGTTGWLDKKTEIEELCRINQGTFFYASNYSIGVNIFFQINKQLARLMSDLNDYKVEMTEIHHTEKKDSPSGTAITLAEGIIENNPSIKNWKEDNHSTEDSVNITSKREGKVPGTHIIEYSSDIDKIEIKHEAFGREGFALGAVLVAEWIKSQSGVLNMQDFLGF